MCFALFVVRIWHVKNDHLLLVSDWGTLVVAKMSPWLQTDSSVDAVRRNSEEVGVQCNVTK